jgi:hypothetical protein
MTRARERLQQAYGWLWGEALSSKTENIARRGK